MDSDPARAAACFASDMVNMQPPPPGMVIGGLGPSAIEPKNEGLMIVVAQKFDGSGDVIIASPNALYAPHGGARVMSERQLLDMEMIVTSEKQTDGAYHKFLVDDKTGTKVKLEWRNGILVIPAKQGVVAKKLKLSGLMQNLIRTVMFKRQYSDVSLPIGERTKTLAMTEQEWRQAYAVHSGAGMKPPSALPQAPCNYDSRGKFVEIMKIKANLVVLPNHVMEVLIQLTPLWMTVEDIKLIEPMMDSMTYSTLCLNMKVWTYLLGRILGVTIKVVV